MTKEWTWENTREAYTDWCSLWPNQSGIKKNIRWRKFPLWWTSNLIAKDTYADYAWYKELHDRMAGKRKQPFFPKSNLTIFIVIFIRLIQYIAKWALVKLIPYPKKKSTLGVRSLWFHCLEYNLISTRESFCDRMYEQVPLDDRKNAFETSYVIRLNIHPRDFFRPLRWIKKISNYSSRLQRGVCVLDKYLTLQKIFEIHFSLAINYAKFLWFSSKISKSCMKIGDIDFYDIFFLEMQKSFIGIMPWSLCYAAMFEEWLRVEGNPKTIVTYGETLAPMRPVLFFAKYVKSKPRIIAVQHGTIYKNKMGFYHRRNEFQGDSLSQVLDVSPMPDYYLVHGKQFKDILSEFYPENRIKIIGCLKNDSIFRQMRNMRNLSDECCSDNHMLLLAPSVGDEKTFLGMLRGLCLPPNVKVVLSGHPSVDVNKVSEIVVGMGLNFSIEINSSVSTAQLMKKAFLVVCSYSSIAFDALLLGVPVVRILDCNRPPVVEDEPGIMRASSTARLGVIIEDAISGGGLKYDHIRAHTLEQYFYKFDGKVSDRFWNEIILLH